MASGASFYRPGGLRDRRRPIQGGDDRMNHQAERDRRARRTATGPTDAGTAGAGDGPAGTTGGGCRSGADAGCSGGGQPMRKQLIVTIAISFCC